MYLLRLSNEIGAYGAGEVIGRSYTGLSQPSFARRAAAPPFDRLYLARRLAYWKMAPPLTRKFCPVT